ncbi:MAG: hypothetical protein NTW87_01565, partial [Planctomycetota bacterium]|nr:hypothetical protein [Planctomycetota bacterium]
MNADVKLDSGAKPMESCSQDLLVGAASVPINPPLGLPLIGYPSNRPNTGVALDLCLRAALFGGADSDSPAAALLVLDTLCVSARVVAALRTRAAEAVPGLDAATVMVAATHTHSAPALFPMRKGGQVTPPDDAYVRQVVAAAGPVVRQAWQARECLRLRVGWTEVRLGHNRRVVDPSGKAVNEWLDPEGLHHGYTDPRVRFLAFHEAASSRVRLLLNTYGCHPVVLGPGNTKVSSDYPGHLVRTLETRTGARLALHLTGAAANTNPRQALAKEPEAPRPCGEALAQAILDALPTARDVMATPVVAHAERVTFALGPGARANYAASDAE